jgi:PKD repeat protein
MRDRIWMKGLVLGIIVMFISSMFSSIIADPGENDPPVADVGGPYFGFINTPIQFDGSGSYDPDGNIISYSWNFGDGGTGTGVTPTHTYTNWGNFTVSLTVMDDGGETDTDQTYAIVHVEPIADAGGPYYGNVEEPITFNGSGSYDLDGHIFNWTWDFGDENFAYGEITTHSYFVGGNYTVNLTVMDNSSHTSYNLTTAFVNNHPDAPIIYEENDTLYVYAIDPDGDDIYYKIDWGDGEISDWFGPYSSGQKAALNHEWEDGVYDIRAKAKDIHNAESPWSDPYTVVIGNHPPDIILIDGPKCGDPGVEYIYSFIAEDFEGYEIYFFVDWGDGTYFDWFGSFPSGTEVDLSHSWNNIGSYNIRAKAKDIYGAEGEWSDPLPIVIGNQPPDDPDIDGSHSGKIGLVYDFSFVTDDPDGDNVTYEIKWGDNISVEKGPYSSGVKIVVNHSWEEPGTYIIEVRVKDEFCEFYSEWTEFEITIKRSRSVNHPLLQKFLERFPLLEKLLTLIRVI